jgi:hypothetical protein
MWQSMAEATSETGKREWTHEVDVGGEAIFEVKGDEPAKSGGWTLDALASGEDLDATGRCREAVGATRHEAVPRVPK